MRKESPVPPAAAPSGQADPLSAPSPDPGLGKEALPPTEGGEERPADGDPAGLTSMQISREGNPDNR